jgi:hypothetical protein
MFVWGLKRAANGRPPGSFETGFFKLIFRTSAEASFLELFFLGKGFLERMQRSYFRSRQLGPEPQSTTMGTFSSMTVSISCCTSCFSWSTSFSGTSKSSSS